jgi:hypothetical protein
MKWIHSPKSSVAPLWPRSGESTPSPRSQYSGSFGGRGSTALDTSRACQVVRISPSSPKRRRFSSMDAFGTDIELAMATASLSHGLASGLISWIRTDDGTPEINVGSTAWDGATLLFGSAVLNGPRKSKNESLNFSRNHHEVG